MARLNDRLEEKYVLKKIEGLADGELKGCGAYGIVRVVSVRGTRCIAKRIHDILKDPRVPPADRDSVKQKFHKECKMLSQLRHPNIVHFVGVHYDRRGDMSLIMEALDSDLRGFFVQREPSISVKLSILLDVSYGLLYLHTQHPTPIIHRDLNPGNILLTRDMKAKIADLGVSSYLSFAKAQTMAPGAWGYMPPEALRENPVYDTSLDVFSFGHIALCVGSHKSLSVVIPPSRVVQQTPIKQRKRYLDALGSRHCLYSVAVDCLHNQPRRRPSTRELCDTLQWLNSTHTVECVVGGSTDVLGETSAANGDRRHAELGTNDGTLGSLQQRVKELTDENSELRVLVDAEKAQADVYKSDFEIERGDREKAHNVIEDYKFQLARLQEKIYQSEENCRHQEAEIYVLKAANIRHGEELRTLRFNQIYGHLPPEEATSAPPKPEEEEQPGYPTPKPRKGYIHRSPPSHYPVEPTTLSHLPSHQPSPHVPQTNRDSVLDSEKMHSRCNHTYAEIP